MGAVAGVKGSSARPPEARPSNYSERVHVRPAPPVAYTSDASPIAYTSDAQSNTGDSTPRILCSFGLVVVYCRCTFRSGKMYFVEPNAASAAS